jgi:hypothetical protein
VGSNVKKTCFDGGTTLERFQTQCVLILEVHFETPKIFNHFNIVHTTNDKFEFKACLWPNLVPFALPIILFALACANEVIVKCFWISNLVTLS